MKFKQKKTCETKKISIRYNNEKISNKEFIININNLNNNNDNNNKNEKNCNKTDAFDELGKFSIELLRCVG